MKQREFILPLSGWPLSARALAEGLSASGFSAGHLLPARLSGVSIHSRLARGGFGGFGAGIRRRGIRRRRLDRGLLDVDHTTRPCEVVRAGRRGCGILTRAQTNEIGRASCRERV